MSNLSTPFAVMTAKALRELAITNADYALFRPDTMRYFANVVNKVHADSMIAEMHDHEADMYIVIEGEGELFLGGSLIEQTTPTPGQHRGTGIAGGTQFILHTGDIAHIPAGTAHMLDVRHGRMTYLVVKINVESQNALTNLP